MRNDFHEFPEACELTLESPWPNETVMVIGRDYKIPGYIDEERVWRRRSDGKKLQDVLEWNSLK